MDLRMIKEEEAARFWITEEGASRKVLEILVTCCDGNAINPLQRISAPADDSNRFSPVGAIQSHVVAACQHSDVSIHETLQAKGVSLFLGRDDFPLTNDEGGNFGRK
jgi:hypothetical protein